MSCSEVEKLKSELSDLKRDYKAFKEYVFFTMRNSNIEINNKCSRKYEAIGNLSKYLNKDTV